MSKPGGTPNLRDTLRIAEARGCSLEQCHRSGELKIRHPTWSKIVKINCRRKDSPRHLLNAIDKIKDPPCTP